MTSTPSSRTLRALFAAIISVLSVNVGVPVARAQFSTVVQTTPFSFTINDTVEGTGFHSYFITPSHAFTASIDPFDSSLGALESFTVAWSLTVTGTIYDSNGMQIGVEGSGSGYLSLGGVVYYRLGSGNGGAKTATFHVQPSTTFLSSEAGASYDLALFETVTGASEYEVYWDVRPDFGIHDAIDGEAYNASAIGSVSVTYSYAASAIPEPSTYALFAGAAMLLGAVVYRRRARA